MDEKLDTIHQCASTAQKNSCILGCTKGSVAGRVRELVLPLYFGLVKLYYFQFRGHQHRKDRALLEQVQRWTQK